MKYQLADLNNGPFGETFDSIGAAEKAIAEVVAEGQAINDSLAAEHEEKSEEVPSAADFYRIVNAETGEEI